MTKKKKARSVDKRAPDRLSLAGMDPEDVIRKALSTLPPEPPKKAARKARSKSSKK